MTWRRALLPPLALVVLSSPLASPPALGQAPDPRPNIVLIVTDDQRWDSLGAMPTVQSELIAKGMTFKNAFVVNSLCCPSRASILTGQYSHTTGIWTNAGPHGGFANFDDSSTIATWLDGAGYDTALVGKYLNGYDGSVVPPGWDRWVANIRTPHYFDYDLNVDGAIASFGSDEGDYLTDVLASEAAAFIEGADPTNPLLLVFSPYAPHRPATPAPRHEGTFPNLPKWRPPSYNEKDVSDKPRWLRKVRRLGPNERQELDRVRRKQYQTLLAVDEAIAQILASLAATGRLDNTLIAFTSDHGYLWGEHRLQKKTYAYNEAIRVPFVVRYDPLALPGTTSRIALNIDFAPTFAELAGIAAPGADGRSLVPLMSGQADGWRAAFLVDHFKLPANIVPTYCAVRKVNKLYVRYRSGFQEYYNLAKDPYELENRAKRPAAKKIVKRLRKKAERLCQPPPPGYSF